MTNPPPIVLADNHYAALRRLKGLASHGLSTLAEELRDEMAAGVGQAHDLIARELAELTGLRAKAKADAEVAAKAAEEVLANAPKPVVLTVVDADKASKTIIVDDHA